MPLIANARMYSVSQATSEAWRHLFAWVAVRSGVELVLLDHEPPLKLSDLWVRDDLGAVMMCGLPISRRPSRPALLAQFVPSPARYAGQAVYCTDIVVAADTPYTTLPETFGLRAGYTLKDSQSGYFAFRHHLLRHHGDVPQPYARITGALMNARGVIQAIAAGRIDVGPLDGYVHDLLRHTDPAFASQVRTIARTEPTPIPAIVATAPLTPAQTDALRAAFVATSQTPTLRETLVTLQLERFAVPAPAAFDGLDARARVVEQAPDWP